MIQIMTGQEIKDWRTKQGIKQTFLADKLGIAVTSLNKIENEKIDGLKNRQIITEYILKQK